MLIKMAPVIRHLDDQKTPYRLVFTGQHRQTMNELRSDFNIREPDIVLWDGPEIDRLSMMPAFLRGVNRAWKRSVSPRIRSDKSRVVVVHGDTISTLLGARLGQADGAEVAHVEAGLRSHRIFDPFPEEIIRRLVSRRTQIHFCPSDWAADNLHRSNVVGEIISTHRNTLYDTLHLGLRMPVPSTLVLPSSPYWLVSLHRFETLSSHRRLEFIVQTLLSIAEHCLVVFILHPTTQLALKKFGLLGRLQIHKAIELRPRMSYVSFIKLLVKSRGLLTDGGSNQEECSYLGHPCLLLRHVTERQEGLESNIAVSKFNQKVIEAWLADPEFYRREPVQSQVSPSTIIVKHLRRFSKT